MASVSQQTTKVSKVYPHNEGWVFAACGDRVKQFKAESRKEALKTRGKLIKQLKLNGYKVINHG